MKLMKNAAIGVAIALIAAGYSSNSGEASRKPDGSVWTANWADPNPEAFDNPWKSDPLRLIELTDISSKYDEIQKGSPGQLSDAKRFIPKGMVTHGKNLDVEINSVTRFNKEDTLVFLLTLKNKSDKKVEYNSDAICIMLNNRPFYPSITDAAGYVPANSAFKAKIAITGSPTGIRNNLHPDNKWTVLISEK